MEAAVAASLALLIVFLHFGFFRDVGGLWRDEANTLQLATVPSVGEIWRWLPYDSFPIGFHLLLRGYASLFSTGDTALRALGLGIGLAIVGALCLNARLLGFRWPLLSLALLGCNPLFIRYGDSVRAYGLGILILLLTLGAVWRVVERLTVGRWLLAAALGVAGVHVVFYNAVLLFALCLAGAVVAAGERAWRKAVALLVLGLPAALSLLVYVPMIREQHRWSSLVGYPATLGWLWRNLCEVTGAPHAAGAWLWTGLFLGALALAGFVAWGNRASVRPAEDTRPLRFAVLVLVLSVGCYAAFLLMLQYRTQSWYYLCLLAPVAFCLDLVFAAGLPASGRWRWTPLVVAAAFAVGTGPDSYVALFARQTNVDIQASRLQKLVQAGDVIVFNRWECAVTFAHYYHGAGALLTLPPLSDHRFHRYDLVKEQMMTPDAARPTLARMEAALRAGHRVWLSGEPVAPAEGAPLVVPRAAEMIDGHFKAYAPYYEVWAEQAGDLLRQHATDLVEVPVSNGQPVINFERTPLTGFSGWH